jgi:hypothetical protein
VKNVLQKSSWAGAVAAAVLLAACAAGSGGAASMNPHSQQVVLSGANEVPANATTAAGSGTVTINPDFSVSGVIVAAGMTATAAHIHEAAAGANGPVVVPLTKTADNTFSAADGAKLTEAQYASYKAGNLYVNVHSAKFPGGEIRAQLKGN